MSLERRVVGSATIPTALRPDFVQPLPGDRLLLAEARTRGTPNGEVWSTCGELLHRAHLGDAIEDLFTTPSGLIWASYFDEALGLPPPAGHGLAASVPV